MIWSLPVWTFAFIGGSMGSVVGEKIARRELFIEEQPYPL
jgi:acetyl-CoA carboxylase beta subunit